MCSVGDAREGKNPAEQGLGCRTPRATSPPCRADRGSVLVLGAAGHSQAVTPCLLLGMWPSVPSLSWTTPGLSHPSLDSRFLFSLPVSLANSLPRTHPGLLGHRLVSPPAPCMLPALPRSAALRLSRAPGPRLPRCPGTEQSHPRRDSVPSPSRARTSPSLTLVHPDSPSFPAILSSPRL